MDNREQANTNDMRMFEDETNEEICALCSVCPVSDIILCDCCPRAYCVDCLKKVLTETVPYLFSFTHIQKNKRNCKY